MLKRMRIPLFAHNSLCPLASPVGLCPPIINLRRDVSRQLSSQSLPSLFRYRSVLRYTLSWLFSPHYWCFCLRERQNLPQPDFSTGLVLKLTIPSQWKHDCCCWVSESWLKFGGGYELWVMEHLRVIISARNIQPLWFYWDVKQPPGELSPNEDG